ncbi:MAG: right-handed parallel beta-helix repeat-containing protein, partial [Armatimonadota bacterium]
MLRSKSSIASLILLLCCIASTASHATVIRVKWDSAIDGPGNDWSHAYRTVTAAIAASVSGGEIWVAGDSAHPYSERITQKAAVGLYGGFAGTETTRAKRNWKTNITILDGGGTGNVVTAPSGATATTVLDGFTIRNAQHGIWCETSSPWITNNTIAGNTESGITCSSSTPTITNNTISRNQISGITCTNSSSPLITFNTISGNGTGITCTVSSPLITNNTLSGNSDGITCNSSSPTIANNVLTGNSQFGISCTTSSSPAITNNTVSGSSTGISCSASASSITNNIVAYSAKGIAVVGSEIPVLSNNCFYNPTGTNYDGLSAGSGDISTDPKFVSAEYGRLHIQQGSPCVDSGLDSAVQPSWKDMDGQLRLQGARVDMGADESDGTLWPEHLPVVV